MSEQPSPPTENLPLSETSLPEPALAQIRAAYEAGKAPTFPPEAEDLLKDLNLGLSNTDFVLDTPLPFPSVAGFEILEKLESGGMGTVFKARQISLNRIIALKMIRCKHDQASAVELIRFMAEAKSMAAIKHPNVVEVYECGEIPGANESELPRPYYAMEFVGGGSLAARLKADGRLTPYESALLALGVARGTQAAHELGIVHRDIKPGNILLATQPGSKQAPDTIDARLNSLTVSSHDLIALHPKMTDFGLAKVAHSDMTRTHVVMGTPAYMSPEQAGGKARFVGPATDIYAIGAVLYECLTGKPPFVAEEPLDLLRQVMDDFPPPPRSLVRNLHPDLNVICMKCLEKNPRDRYARAADLAGDLAAYLAGRPVQAHPLSIQRRMVRWARRRPAEATLYALIFAMLFIIPPLFFWYRGKLETQRVAATEANKAETIAKQARIEAEELAAARLKLAIQAKQEQATAEELTKRHELFARISNTRRRSIDRPLGWTRTNNTDLRAAAQIAFDDEMKLTLRSTAATTLLASDLLPVEPIGVGLTAGRIATANTPDGPVVALGEFKAWGFLGQLSCTIRLVHPNTGLTLRTFTFPASAVSNSGPVQDGVRSLAFSPDGTKLFVGPRSSRLFYFDLTNRKRSDLTRTWMISSRSVEQIVVDREGHYALALCRSANAIICCNIDTGERSEFLTTRSAGFRAMALDAVSNDLLTVEGETLQRWSLTTRKPIDPGVWFGPHYPLAFELLPGGQALLISTLDQLRVFDSHTFQEATRFYDPTLGRSAHEETIRHVAVHPTCAFIATVTEANEDRLVKIWTLGAGRLVGSLAVPGTSPIALAWSPDGRYLFATSTKQTLRFQFLKSKVESHGPFSAGLQRAVTFGPTGDTIISLVEPPGSMVSLHAALLEGPVCSNESSLHRLPDASGSGTYGLAIHPENEHFLVSRPGAGLGMHVCPRENTLNTAAVILSREASLNPRFSPNGATMWAILEGLKLSAWETSSQKRIGSWSNAFLAKTLSGHTDLDALAAGNDWAAVGGRDGTIHFISREMKRLKSFSDPGDPVKTLTLSPDEKLLVAGSRSGRVRALSVPDQTELPKFGMHSGGVTAVAFHPGGGVLTTGGKDRAIRFWQRNGNSFVLLFSVTDLPSQVVSLEFAPGGDALLVLLMNERSARVWDLAALQKELVTLTLGW